VLTPSGASAPLVVRLGGQNTNDKIDLSPESETGSSVFGTTTYFPFSLQARNPIASGTDIIVSGEGLGKHKFPLQRRTFIVPSMTDISGTLLRLTVASQPGNNLQTARITAPVSQQGTLGPKLVELTATLTKLQDQKDGYDIWQGSGDMGQPPTGFVSVEVLSNGVVVDSLMVNSGAAGW